MHNINYITLCYGGIPKVPKMKPEKKKKERKKKKIIPKKILTKFNKNKNKLKTN